MHCIFLPSTPPCGAIGATFRFFPRHCRNRSNPGPSFETQKLPRDWRLGAAHRGVDLDSAQMSVELFQVDIRIWTRRCRERRNAQYRRALQQPGSLTNDLMGGGNGECSGPAELSRPSQVQVQVQVQVVACLQLPATACNFPVKNRNFHGRTRPPSLDRLAVGEAGTGTDKTDFFYPSPSLPAWGPPVSLVLPHCGSVSSTRALGPPACVQLAWHTPPPHRRPPRRTPAFSSILPPPRSVVQALFSPMRAGLLAYRIPSHFPARSRFALLPVPFADFPPVQVPRNSSFLFSPDLAQSASQAPSVASFSGGARPLRH